MTTPAHPSMANLPGRQPARKRRMRGQAMIEYIVVLAFGVVLLIQSSATEEAPVKKLATAIRDYHKHYTYGMAIATIPDCDANYSYTPPTGDLVFTIDVNVDRCVDWTNPVIPIPNLNLTSSLGLPTDPAVFVRNIVTNMLSSALSTFTNPANLFSADQFSFSPSDFF